MQPNGMIFWDWNGTLMDDVDFTHGCLNWMLESHGYPQRYDLAQYRELFRFPIEDYYRLAGFDFSRHPYPMLAEHFMAHYNAGVDACPVMAHAVDTLTELARRGWKQAVLSASRRDYLIEQVAARGLQGFFTELLGLADIYGVSKVQLGTSPAHCWKLPAPMSSTTWPCCRICWRAYNAKPTTCDGCITGGFCVYERPGSIFLQKVHAKSG